MNLKKATKIVLKTLGNKQDPDTIQYKKTWDEFGRLKGYDVYCRWGEYMVMIDITDHYVRIVNDLDKVPEYIKGKHQKI
jgi:hypothetical protein